MVTTMSSSSTTTTNQQEQEQEPNKEQEEQEQPPPTKIRRIVQQHHHHHHHRGFGFGRPKILLLGDSLTQTSFDPNGGWGCILSNVYQRRADVVNLGCSGYNTNFYIHYSGLRSTRTSSNDKNTNDSDNTNDNGNDNKITNTNTNDNDVVVMNSSNNGDVCFIDENDVINSCFITIFFGANDAALEKIDPHHYVPIDTYKENLIYIIQSLQKQKIQKQQQQQQQKKTNSSDTTTSSNSLRILLITPPPVHHKQRLEYQIKRWGIDKATGVLERTLENTGLYAKACMDVSKQFNIPCLNLYDDMINSCCNSTTKNNNNNKCKKDDDDDENNNNHDDESDDADTDDYGKYFIDGLHFSIAGHEFVANAILNAIQEHYKDIQVIPDIKTKQYCNSSSKCISLQTPLPYHDQIDHNKL